MRCVVNRAGASELQPNVTTAAWSSQRHVVLLHYPHGRRRCLFCWLIPDTFRVKCGVQSVSRGAIPVGIHHLVFQKELILENSILIPPCTQYHFLWMKIGAFGVVHGGSFHLPCELFHSTLLYSIHFSSPVTICFKNRAFFVMFKQSHLRKYGQGSPHPLLKWNPNIKAINITKLVQMIFSAWFGYFEYVGYLLWHITLIVLS